MDEETRMNVLHVCPYFPPAEGFGGVPQAVEQLVKAQIKQDITVNVFTTCSRIQAYHSVQEFKHPKVNYVQSLGNGHIFYFKNSIPFLADQHKFFTPTFAYNDIEELIEQSIDVIHFHEVNIAGYKSFALQGLENQKGICISLHGSYRPPTHGYFKKLAHKIIDPVLQYKWFGKCHGYFITSDYEKEKLLLAKINTERIYEIPFGKPEVQFEREFRFSIYPSLLTTVLVLGRINIQKGIDTAFQVFQHAKKQNMLFRMLFVGQDEGGIESLTKWSKQNDTPVFINQPVNKEGIYIFPSVEHGELYDLFQKVDVTLCPSPYESFGLVPLESLSCGTPVVMSSFYGCCKFIKDDQPTVYIAEGIDDYYNGIIRAVRDDAKQIKFDFPSWDDAAQQFNNSYQELIHKNE